MYNRQGFCPACCMVRSFILTVIVFWRFVISPSILIEKYVEKVNLNKHETYFNRVGYLETKLPQTGFHSLHFSCQINLFVPNAPLLYPLKNIRKPYSFLMFSGGIEKVHWERISRPRNQFFIAQLYITYYHFFCFSNTKIRLVLLFETSNF